MFFTMVKKEAESFPGQWEKRFAYFPTFMGEHNGTDCYVWFEHYEYQLVYCDEWIHNFKRRYKDHPEVEFSVMKYS